MERCRPASVIALALLIAGAGGCYLSHERDGPEPEGGLCEPRPLPEGGDVDLLLVIDQSPTMQNEQAALAEALPGFVDSLLLGDPNGDGSSELPPATSVQIGVVSTDMGTGGHDVPTCPNPVRGDDGVLLERCGGATPFLRVCTPDMSDHVGCVVPLGHEGCGFEQPLEATLKALSPASSDIDFFASTPAHGDGANDGFLREGSVLAVLVVSDEDDCSSANPGLYDPDSATFTEHYDLRCVRHPEVMHGIERYADGLLGLRDDPARLVFSFLGGVPPDLEGVPPSVALEDPRMDPEGSPTRIPTVCHARDGGVSPAPRMLELAGRLEARGARGVPRSLCHEDLGRALRPLARAIAESLRDAG